MDARKNLQAVFRELLDNPGDPALMCILADALEDVGAGRLAAAYRWAAGLKRWPFPCVGHCFVGTNQYGRKVYDWDSDREDRISARVPEQARLPHEIFRVMRGVPAGTSRLRDKKYGGIHRAFVLLARALEAVAGGDPVAVPPRPL